MAELSALLVNMKNTKHAIALYCCVTPFQLPVNITTQDVINNVTTPAKCAGVVHGDLKVHDKYENHDVMQVKIIINRTSLCNVTSLQSMTAHDVHSK